MNTVECTKITFQLSHRPLGGMTLGKKLRSLEKNDVPWKKKYVPWEKKLAPLPLFSSGPVVLWSGPVVLWSCGPLERCILGGEHNNCRSSISRAR